MGDNGSFDLQDFNKVGNEKHLLDERYYFTSRKGKDNCELLGEIYAKITVANAFAYVIESIFGSNLTLKFYLCHSNSLSNSYSSS